MIPDTCIFCGKQLTSEEIEVFGECCQKCNNERIAEQAHPDDHK